MTNKTKENIRIYLAPLIDTITYPFAYVCALYMKIIRKISFIHLPLLKKLMYRIGVFPIIDQYYEPMFNPNHLSSSLREDRNLPGIDMNTAGQLELLNKFEYAEELKSIPMDKVDGEICYYYNNPSYKAGDSEYLYNMIRHFKPKRIIEVGSGYSTLMAIEAIKRNAGEGVYCIQQCIEPYEMEWLEKTSATIIRKKLEDVDKDLFSQLESDDMLIIDSSHIIRPQGDVLVEYLEILPILKPGVIVHIHDIFTPKDYLDEWVLGEVRFWNEQYILEAFLTNNSEYEIIGAVNYLKHHYYGRIKEKCPMLSEENEPGAFWIRKKSV